MTYGRRDRLTPGQFGLTVTPCITLCKKAALSKAPHDVRRPWIVHLTVGVSTYQDLCLILEKGELASPG